MQQHDDSQTLSRYAAIRRARQTLATLLLAAVALLGVARPAAGDEIHVTNGAQLRSELQSTKPGDTIYLDAAGTYDLAATVFLIDSISIVFTVEKITVTGGEIRPISAGVTLTLVANAEAVWNVPLKGSLSLVTSGIHVLSMSGATSISGSITVTNPELRITSSMDTRNAPLTVNAGSTLSVVDNSYFQVNAISGAGNFSIESSATLQTSIDGTSTVSGKISSNGYGTLRKAGSGTLMLANPQNNTSAWRLTIAEGTVSVSSPASLGTGEITVDSTTATLEVATGGELVNTISFIPDLVPMGINLAIHGDTTLTGNIESQPGPFFTKSGPQTLTLSGTSDTSSTHVSEGMLVVDGSLRTTGLVTVASGATLAGSGTVGLVTASNGSTIAPGSGGVGTLTANSLVMNPGANLNFELGAPTDPYDKLAITGALTLHGALNITDIGGFGPGIYTLMTYGAYVINNGLTLPAPPEGLTLTLSFIPLGEVRLIVDTLKYSVQYSAGANGSLTGDTSQTVEHASSSTAVTAVPAAGYRFLKWSDGSTDNPRIDANVTDNISVTAEFALNEYKLTYAAGANGSLSGTASQTVNHGAAGTAVTAVPDAGYRFVRWSDGSTANPRTDTNVMADLSVTAQFSISAHTLTYSAGANGTVIGATSQTVNHGGDGTAVIAIADGGYEFSQWSDGSIANPRTDTNVTASLAVTALFTPLPPPPDPTLYGLYYNNDTLIDPQLGSGTHVIGGRIGGNIVGTGEQPARIDAEILPGSTLCNVIIGADGILHLPSTLCPSVRFADGAQIPAGMELTSQFDPQPWSGNGAIFALDLNRTLHENGATLFDGLQELPALGTFTLTQDANTRALSAQDGNVLATLLPIAVTQAATPFVPGIAYDSNGHLVITNASGQQVTFLPLPGGSAQLETALQTLGLQSSRNAEGTLLVVDAEGRPRYVAHAAVVATPAPAGSTPGLSQHQSHLLAGTTLFELVFADDEGQLWRQALWPAPLYWRNVVDTLRSDPRNKAVHLGNDGLLTITWGNGTIRGYFDYRVMPAGADAQPGRTFVSLGEPADRNGDGTPDWLVIYPDGSTQVFYLVP